MQCNHPAHVRQELPRVEELPERAAQRRVHHLTARYICESKTSSPGPGGVTLSNSFALTPPGPLAAGKLGRAEFGLFFAFAHRFNELDAMFKQSNALPATLGLCASHCNARSTTA